MPIDNLYETPPAANIALREEAGWLTSEWGESENNRRAKFFRLIKTGHRKLTRGTDNWCRIATAMAGAPEIP